MVGDREGSPLRVEANRSRKFAPRAIRTPDLLIRSQMLYPAELWVHIMQ